MSDKAMNGIMIPLGGVCSIVQDATGISKLMIARITKEGEKVDIGISTSIETLGK
jgi:hypothetical protein